MKDKINIAELLKDCPKGMELDCALYDNVFFDGIDTNDDNFPISLYYKHNNIKNGFSVTKYGTYYNHQNTKCIIFPKGKTTWEGFVPPCQFKDGDIVFISDEYSDTTFTYVAIFEEMQGDEIFMYCAYNYEDNAFYTEDFSLDVYNTRFATEEEKQKLFDAIKANGYKWNEKTKTLEKLVKPKFKVGDVIQDIDTYKVKITEVSIEDECYEYESMDIKGIGSIGFSEQDNWELVPNKFDINTLVPFESRVLVRDNKLQKWHPAMWGFYDLDFQDYPYKIVGAAARYCIPYEKNEYLLGTTDDCDEFYKNW